MTAPDDGEPTGPGTPSLRPDGLPVVPDLVPPSVPGAAPPDVPAPVPPEPGPNGVPAAPPDPDLHDTVVHPRSAGCLIPESPPPAALVPPPGPTPAPLPGAGLSPVPGASVHGSVAPSAPGGPTVGQPGGPAVLVPPAPYGQPGPAGPLPPPGPAAAPQALAPTGAPPPGGYAPGVPAALPTAGYVPGMPPVNGYVPGAPSSAVPLQATAGRPGMPPAAPPAASVGPTAAPGLAPPGVGNLSAPGASPTSAGQYPVVPGSYPGPAGPYTFDPMLSDATAHDERAAPASPERSQRQKMLRLTLVGVLTLVVALAVFLMASTGGSEAQASASASASRTAAAEGAVAGYLDAVARGDAGRALDYLAETPSSTALLTYDVLDQSREAAKLTVVDVRARSSSDDSVAVKANYRLGEAGVDQTFTVKEVGGSWKIVGGTATVDLSAVAGDLPLAVNGQAVKDSSKVVLFPGSYALTLTGDKGKYFTLGTTTFQVTNLDNVKLPAISAALTDDGVAAFRQAVRAAVDACVASPDLASGCPGSGLDLPAQLPDGTVITEGSVVRTLSPELDAALNALVPRLSSTNPASAYAPVPEGLVNIAYTGTLGDQPAGGDLTNVRTGAPGFPLTTPRVDMTDPGLPVTWSDR